MAVADVQVELARISEENAGLPVRYIDDVSLPLDDGHWTTLAVLCEGRPVEILVMTTEAFYDALGKVAAAAMPGVMGKKLS